MTVSSPGPGGPSSPGPQGLGRRALLAGVAALASAAAWKIGPRMYNARRVRALAGRHVYDEGADPAALIADALGRGARGHKRVVAILGGNWCQWCLALDDLMTTDEAIRSALAERFIVVHLDSSAAAALDEAWRTPTRLGVPVLVFLDPDGSVAHVQSSIPLETLGGRLLAHDRARVLAVLRAWSL